MRKKADEKEEAVRLTQRMMSGRFTLNDMYKQMEMMSKVGTIDKLMSFLPGNMLGGLGGMSKSQKQAMQGNLDPCALFAPKDKLKGYINSVLEQAYEPNSQNKINNRYIFNLGHGILPPSDPDKLDFLINQVHNFN